MPLRIAFFGQAAFGKDCYERLLEAGHEMVGVYTPPEGRRPDPLAEAARERGDRLIQVKAFRRRSGGGFEPIPARIAEHASPACKTTPENSRPGQKLSRSGSAASALFAASYTPWHTNTSA